MKDITPIHDESVDSVEESGSHGWAFLLQPAHCFRWWASVFVAFFLCLGLILSLVYMTSTGVGVLGVHQGVPWGWDIMNFIFWIGIAHAGTLISAILLLSRQVWRRSVSRLAELITLCAVLCASIYPLFHIGRVWMAWFFMPVPESNAMWQNFLSPLMWDAFAVGTYACVSLIFFYVSMVPDLGMMAKSATSERVRCIYGALSLGWTGSVHQLVMYKRVCWLLALILTPLVISVHSIVSYDFAVTLVPGWQVSVFPPYFVTGAILSGLSMVMIVVLPMRRFFGLARFVSMDDLGSMAKLMAAVSLLMGTFYLSEHVFSGEHESLSGRHTGMYYLLFGMMVLVNVLLPQFLWMKKWRSRTWALTLISLVCLWGMWIERLLIVVGSSERAFLASGWTNYAPSIVDVVMFVGSFGLFTSLILLGMRVFPLVNLHELGQGDDDHLRLGVQNTSVTQEIDAEKPPLQKDASGFVWPHKGMGGWTMLGALAGCLFGCALLYYTQIVDYPLILQGRVAGWGRFLGFMPVLLEMTLMGAALFLVGTWVSRMLK